MTKASFDFTEFLYGAVIFVLVIPAGFYYLASLGKLPQGLTIGLLATYGVALFIGIMIRINQLPGGNGHD